MTPVRAAWILGERYERKAVPALTKIVKKAKDAFLVESAVEALGKISGSAATAAVRAATQHSSLRVRVKAREVLTDLVSKSSRTSDE
jgi:HEAT repeat protein